MSTVRPVTPSEAFGKPAPRDHVAEGIARLNATLREPWRNGERVRGRTVAASLLGPFSDEVVSAFRSAGWTVERIDDPREGDYYTFRAPRGNAEPPGSAV